jgi:SAM-dependent methyltransferase
LGELSYREQEMEAVEEFFPATAMPDRDWWATLWPDPEGVVRSLGVSLGTVVVDLCCGDGYFTAPLAQIVEGNVYGVDIDPAMLEQTGAELERAGTTALDLICADARDLPELLPSKVDYVLIANTFHGVPDKTAMARAVAAVLNPAGRFAVVNWHPLPRERTVVLNKPRGPKTEMRMSPEDVRSVVEPAGFTQERVVDLPPFHYGAVFRVVAE